MSEQLENQDAVEQSSEAIVNPFADESWIDSVNAEDEQVNAPIENQNLDGEDVTQQQQEDEIYDADEYLRQNLGFDSWEEAKEQIEQLRKASEATYDNEESFKIHKALLEGKKEEIYSYLDQQLKLEKLMSSDLDDSNASEIVKLAMKAKYPELTDDEINYKFKKQFNFPEEPEQMYTETDEEFEERKQIWEDQVKDIKMELMIEAKTSRNIVEQFKKEIRLPDIPYDSLQAEPTQEELDQANAYVQNYMGDVYDSLDSFEGFNVDYKDEEVSFKTTYVPSDEEKQVVSSIMKTFADTGFNANMIFADRWVDDEGNINAYQMARDIALLYSEEKVMQKLVNDGVAKRLAEYRKSTSNINVSGRTNGNFNPKSNEANDMAAFFFGQ